MSRCPVDLAEIENDRIVNGRPRMIRANGFELEPRELVEEVKLEKLGEFVEDLMNNHDYVIGGKTFALHECLADIDYDHEMWGVKIAERGACKTFGEVFKDDPIEAAQLVADRLIHDKHRPVIIDSVIRVGKLAIDIDED